MDSAGEWIMAHCVALDRPLVGTARLAKMAAMAIAECLAGAPEVNYDPLPLLLCIAERERPGRVEGLNDDLLPQIESQLGVGFSNQSLIVPQGRVSIAVAMDRARRLIHEHGLPHVLIAASDSFLNWGTIGYYEKMGRLLTADNSNGFMCGEGAGALLICAAGNGPELVCTGVGFGTEAAHIESQSPLRADGLTAAITAALAEARLRMGDMDFRITDLSGEQYYFKEASLAVARTLRTHKEDFPLWHPAECTGEQGAAAGTAAIALAESAFRKAFADGSRALLHMANDAGQRAALTLEYGVVQ